MRDYKYAAAARALDLVSGGMRLGLGSGSTAECFFELLGQRIRDDGIKVVGVASSERTAQAARDHGIPLTDLDDVPYLDLTVDGADEIDSELRLIKGGGGALLREKIVATASEQVVIIADNSKLVTTLGAFALPIEIERFGQAATQAMVLAVAQDAHCTGTVKVRTGSDGAPFITDGGHLIIDCDFKEIREPELLADHLSLVPGVIETGLFLGVADRAFIAGRTGVDELIAPT
ncbi:MAG: ribose-5-phosphate isomerase RpiA [Pseudomonadota bacterium]